MQKDPRRQRAASRIAPDKGNTTPSDGYDTLRSPAKKPAIITPRNVCGPNDRKPKWSDPESSRQYLIRGPCGRSPKGFKANKRAPRSITAYLNVHDDPGPPSPKPSRKRNVRYQGKRNAIPGDLAAFKALKRQRQRNP